MTRPPLGPASPSFCSARFPTRRGSRPTDGAIRTSSACPWRFVRAQGPSGSGLMLDEFVSPRGRRRCRTAPQPRYEAREGKVPSVRIRVRSSAAVHPTDGTTRHTTHDTTQPRWTITTSAAGTPPQPPQSLLHHQPSTTTTTSTTPTNKQQPTTTTTTSHPRPTFPPNHAGYSPQNPPLSLTPSCRAADGLQLRDVPLADGASAESQAVWPTPFCPIGRRPTLVSLPSRPARSD